LQRRRRFRILETREDDSRAKDRGLFTGFAEHRTIAIVELPFGSQKWIRCRFPKKLGQVCNHRVDRRSFWPCVFGMGDVRILM